MRGVAAMSGGVDSAVAASRMLEAGHEVVGVHLALSQNAATLRESARGCCTIEDAGDARRVADMIGIPFYVWALAARFKNDVVDDFVAEYAAGRIGFLNRERSGLESIFPQLPEKPGARCNVAQFDGVGLRAHYGREAKLRGDGSGAQGRALLEYFAAGVGVVVLAVFHFPFSFGWRLA